VIFTSGSTGRPKGAVLSHRGVVNRLLWMQDAYDIGPGDRVLQKTPYSFDVSVWEFFWPLLTGATLVMAQPDGHKSPAYVAAAIEGKGITVCHFVPSLLGVFLTQPELPACATLRYVFCSGEALPYQTTSQFRERLPHVQLHNLYGPTEASVDVSHWRCEPDEARRLVPIGRPVANTQLYVLDADLEPLPVGVPGQLYLGGVQLATGYLKRPQLTAERFITHPRFGRLYVTGDAARWLPDGAVDFLGRLDGQVKLRGQRIELGEIEARLDALPQVAESACAVRARTAGDERLVAWVVPAAGACIDAGELADALRRDLPEFMIPQHIVAIGALPRLTSGKIERKALPELAELPVPRRAALPPATPAEKAVAAVWQQLLGTAAVNRDDRFFDLGGHSLLAVQAVTLLKQRFGVKPSLRSAMMATLAGLAQEVEGQSPAAARPVQDSKPTALSRQEAFYFGAAGERLFGVITRPALPRKAQAILICQSWGVEYMRSHRALQLLAQRLAESGFCVMRFDYYGTGDSAGESRGAGVQDWVRNIRAAARELRTRTGLHRLALLGVRLGALLAVHAREEGLDADQLLLWDPPPDGAKWLAELTRLCQLSHDNWNRQRPRSTKLPPPPADQIFGMTVSQEWLDGIAQLAPPLAGNGVRIVQSRDEAPAAAPVVQALPDDSCWAQLGWITRPWNPRASSEQVANLLERTLP
ncbi:MAG TPA: amino acid adenylation domain-containing protein, partial [Nevskiaceae bacterium]|nr:amino acid adenylation domain-containing protein [Nevskiaceae bacterium]